MYPLVGGMVAPKTQWDMAAWSKEVSRKPMDERKVTETESRVGGRMISGPVADNDARGDMLADRPGLARRGQSQ